MKEVTEETRREMVAFLEETYDMDYSEAVLAVQQWQDILGMIVDGAWVALNILGPMTFSYTTKQNHTVEIKIRAVPN